MPESIDGGWVPLLPSRFAGPQDLCALVVDFRRWCAQRETALPPGLVRAYISDAGLGCLLDLAYQASLEKDEGRYTRLRIFVPGENPALGSRLLVRFAEPIKLQDSGPLRRLAPAVAPHDYALRVGEDGGELNADGIVSLDDPGEDVPLGDLGLTALMAIPGLIVRVAGPGELRVSETMLGTYELSAGRIRALDPFNLAIPVHKWLHHHAATVLTQSRLAERADAAVIEHAAYVMARALWSRVLLTAVELQHGGAFIIVPDDASKDLIKIKYPATGIRLSQSMSEFFRTCAGVQDETECIGFREAVREWLRRKWDIQAEARALGQLSAIDGCVVVNSDLNLLGFGGHIQVDEGQARKAGRGFVDFQTREPRPESDLNRFGTRHGSAFRLCQAVQNCMAFVVSQDGHLRVFASNAEHVYLFDALAVEARYKDKS